MDKTFFDLQLFAEGGAGAAGGDGGAAAGAGDATGVTVPAAEGRKQRRTNPLANVKYGVQQEQAQGGVAAANAEAANTIDGNESFEDLIKGKYKSEFDARVQDIIRSRFKQNGEMEERLNSLNPLLEGLGYNVSAYTFADSNDVANVTASACADCDVLYIPTDNTAASCTEAINNVALNEGTPIICGEEGICSGCGVATLSISYYDLGWATGEMAAEILVDGADVSSMEVRYAPKFEKKFNSANCDALGITPPAEYVAIG